MHSIPVIVSREDFQKAQSRENKKRSERGYLSDSVHTPLTPEEFEVLRQGVTKNLLSGNTNGSHTSLEYLIQAGQKGSWNERRFSRRILQIKRGKWKNIVYTLQHHASQPASSLSENVGELDYFLRESYGEFYGGKA